MCIRDSRCIIQEQRLEIVEKMCELRIRCLIRLELIPQFPEICPLVFRKDAEPIADLKTTPGLESAGEELERVFLTLEAHSRDMCDIEFTIEQGKLGMLQTRVGKRTAKMCIRDSP